MFPALYHAHHSRHMEDLPFWLSLAQEVPGPLLELGCGTGRLLAPLAAAVTPTFGLDRDLGMLKFFKSRISPDLTLSVRVFAADMTAFALHLRFPLIILPCNTYSTLLPGARLAVLECVCRHLHPAGRFCASLPNPAALARLPRRGDSELEDEFFHPLDGEPVQVSSAWERMHGRLAIRWHYDHLLPDGRVERLTAETSHSMEPVSTLLDELLTAGFKVIETFGDYDRSPYHSDSPYWIFSASH
jgi:SAM-dependent methyltransferase